MFIYNGATFEACWNEKTLNVLCITFFLYCFTENIVLCEQIVKEYEHNMSEMVATFCEQVQAYMAQLRDLENQHNEVSIFLEFIFL